MPTERSRIRRCESARPKPRPKLFRALGDRDPPQQIEIDGGSFRRVEILKHDSWAATALYQAGDRKVVCKCNRIQPILGMPCRWLGAFLARREAELYAQLADVPSVPRGLGRVVVDGRILPNAVAHDYVPGHPLCWHDLVGERFFQSLADTLQQIHRRGIAYVDLNKRENIIVDPDGEPHLIDFQISIRLPRVWPATVLLRWLQQSDSYHLNKHLAWFRPDLFGYDRLAGPARRRPWWISLHRRLTVPLRELRRRLLVRLGVRRGSGKADSERFVEQGLRAGVRHDSPLLRLHATLVSDAYYQARGGADRAYAHRMFQDLLERPPKDRQEHALLHSLLASRSRHHIAVGMLRCAQVFARSGNLSETWLSEVHQKILEGLPTQANGSDTPSNTPTSATADGGAA